MGYLFIRVDTEASRAGKEAQLVLNEIEWIIVKPKEYHKAHLIDQVDIDGKNLLLPG